MLETTGNKTACSIFQKFAFEGFGIMWNDYIKG